jgi:CBS domain-containing protein
MAIQTPHTYEDTRGEPVSCSTGAMPDDGPVLREVANGTGALRGERMMSTSILRIVDCTSAMPQGEDEETVARLMDIRVRTLDLNASARECARKMAKESADCVVLVEGEKPLGVLTERDLVIKILSDGLDPDKVLARDIMSTALITIAPGASMSDAARLMSEHKIRRLLVVDGRGSLVGIASADDLAKVLAKRHDYRDPALNVMGRVNETPSAGPYK